jgi:hypothetical protein
LESFPETETSLDPNCVPQMNRAGINAQTWLAHAVDTIDFVGSLHPGVQILWDLNDQGQLDADHEYHGFVTTVAAEARKYGFLVGNDGFPNGFGAWTGVYTTNAPHSYAQTASLVNQQSLSNFGAILRQASSLGIHTLELYGAEWSIAYNPKNPNYPTYGASYQAAMKSISMGSGPVCRLGPGQY